MFDYGFPENGLAYYRGRNLVSEVSFIQHIGEEKYKLFVNFILHYLADMDVPIKRFVCDDPSLLFMKLKHFQRDFCRVQEEYDQCQPNRT